MNTGVVAARYAKALLKYVNEAGAGSRVYAQVSVLAGIMTELPQFKAVIDNGEISFADRIGLFESALGEPVAEELASFLRLVMSRRRTDAFSRILYAFITRYRQENNIKSGRLVTAVPVDGLSRRLETLIHDKTGAQVQLVEKTDPSIIGGFVFEIDGYRLDASVERQLKRLRRQLVEKNNRIV